MDYEKLWKGLNKELLSFAAYNANKMKNFKNKKAPGFKAAETVLNTTVTIKNRMDKLEHDQKEAEAKAEKPKE